MRCLKVLKVPFLGTPCISCVICGWPKLIQNQKGFFWFKVHLSYHPRINSACLVFQTQPVEQLALSWCSGKAHQCHLCRCTCPEVSPKMWRFMGCRKLTFNLNFGILRCSAFRICKTLWGLKWTGALLGANHNHLVVLLALKGRSHSKKRGTCRRMRGGVNSS